MLHNSAVVGAVVALVVLLAGCSGLVENRGDDAMVRLVKGDLDLLAKVVWAEARSEPFAGQCAIVHVILNRLAREPGRFPRTIQGIIKQPYAFSCFNTSDPQCERVKVVDESDPAYLEAMHAVTAVLTGSFRDPTGSADHYHTASLKNYPTWAKKYPMVKRLGSHLFYKEPR